MGARICAAVAMLPGAVASGYWCSARAETLPRAIETQLPAGYEVLEWRTGLKESGAARPDWLVALHKPDEKAIYDTTGHSPARPLLIFRPAGTGAYVLVGRNDAVIFGIGDGGQCDPFGDDGQGLAVRDGFFTVQNQVACGQHWTDFITFRFDAGRHVFLFHNERTQSLKMNPSNDPGAEALVPQASTVRRADPHHPVTFNGFRLQR